MILTATLTSYISPPVRPLAYVGHARLTSQHVFIPAHYLVLADILGRAIFVDNDPVRVHDSIRRYGGIGCGSLEREIGCELAIDCPGKMYTATGMSIAVILERVVLLTDLSRASETQSCIVLGFSIADSIADSR